jgi:hypothetical protein
MNDYINKIIKEHEDGKCNCDRENDCMCLAMQYLGGSISYEDFIEELDMILQ